tara:strand:+ start:843 stop:2855 length:2013 start_codon:yes stop_codon:yes gene_type:complete
MTSSRKMLVTSALPYANGPLHLGHLVEHIQTDIWVRVHTMQGHECLAICGDDAHGTPIMLKAEQLGMTAEALTASIKAQHEQDFADFAIHYDSYHTTHSAENEALMQQIYTALEQNGDILKRTVSQAFDPIKSLFLPDRYVKGSCPKCHAPDQYGDNCEACGATYAPTDLIDPISALSGVKPVTKSSEHHFFDLARYSDLLKAWLKTNVVAPEIYHKLQEWFDVGLKPWDISRDAPYFGFLLPGTSDKYAYVWLDAPIGYMASFKHYCDQHAHDFATFWQQGAQTELYHFIGKDIVYFHTLFWPAMLAGAGFRLPTQIFVHGFLTVNGQKMSKSRGTFIEARTYLNHLNPEFLRYYFAAKLNGKIEDIDLNWEDFTQRINADLVGKVVNIASRCSGFINQHFAGRLSDSLADTTLFEAVLAKKDAIITAYEARDSAKAVRLIMECAALANQYIDAQKPWVKIKTADNKALVQAICTMGLNLFRLIMAYLKPILPNTAKAAEAFLNIEPLSWASIASPLLNHHINTFKPLLTRVDPNHIEALMQESQTSTTPASTNTTQTSDKTDVIGIEDFAKVDLRIAQIVEAKPVEGADKLLHLVLDVGGTQKNVFAGIKAAYEPAQLIGRLTIMVNNLAPRKMRFGVSEGMVLAAGNGQDIYLLQPDTGATPGMKVK